METMNKSKQQTLQTASISTTPISGASSSSFIEKKVELPHLQSRFEAINSRYATAYAAMQNVEREVNKVMQEWEIKDKA